MPHRQKFRKKRLKRAVYLGIIRERHETDGLFGSFVHINKILASPARQRGAGAGQPEKWRVKICQLEILGSIWVPLPYWFM